MIAGSLEIQLLANMARLQKDMDQAKRMVGGAMKHIENTVASAKAALGALGTGISAVAFVHWIKGAIDAADSMNDLRKSTSLTIEELAGLKLASKQSGSDLEGTAKAINKLSKEIGADAERFRALGITAKDPLEAFKQLSDILRGIEDPQLRAAVAAGALGKGWESAAPLLAEGSKKIGEMVEKGALLSGMTQQNGDDADEFNDRMAELQTALDGTATNIASNLLPVLTALAEDLRDNAAAANNTTVAFDPLTETLRALIIVGGNVAFVFKGIGTEIGGMAAQVAAVASGDFKGALAIGRMMKEDADQARTAFDAWEQKMLAAGTAARTVAEETDAVTKTNENVARSFAKTGGGADKAVEAYESLIKSIREKIAVEEAAEKAGGKLSESQKLRVELESKLGEVVKKYGPAQRALVQSFIDQLIPMTERNRLAEEYAKLLDAEAKAIIDSEVAAMKSFADAQRQSVISYGELIDQLELETKALGMTSEQREKYIALKKLDREYTLGLIETETDYLARVNEINAAFSKRDEAKQYFEEHTALWKSIESTAHDTFISIFDSGKSAFDRLRDTLKNGLYELLYQMTLKKWIFNISASGSGSGVGGTVSNALGGGGNTGIGGFNPLGSIGNSVVGAIGGMGGFGAGFASGISEAALGASFVGPSASLAGGSVGLGATFAAAIPWVAVAIAVASLLMKEGGGPKTEGDFFGTLGAGGLLTQQATETGGNGIWYTGNSADATVAQIAAPIGAAVWQTIRDLGGDATGLGINLGYNTDPMGDAPDNISAGVTDASGNYVYRQTYDVDRGAAGEALQVEVQRMILAALQAVDLNDTVDAYLDTLDIGSLSAEQAAAALKYVKALNDVDKALERLGFGAESLTPTLINAAGGLESLQASLSSFYDLYYTETEKQAMAQADLVAQFEALNLALPESKGAFRDLVEGIDRSTTAGEEMFAALLRLAPAFAQAADAAEAAAQQATDAARQSADAQDQMWRDYHDSMEAAERAEAEARLRALEEQRRAAEEAQRIADQQAAAFATWTSGLREWLDALNQNDQLSPLTAQQKLLEAQNTYVEGLMLAQAGDAAARGNITRYAEEYLAAQKAVSGFGGDYSSVFSSVRDQIDQLAGGGSSEDDPPTSGDIGSLRQEVTDLKVVLARLMEIGNANNVAQTEAIVSAITNSGTTISTATTTAAVLTKKA